MELWICKRNELAVLKDARKVSFFRVNDPHQPIETLDYLSSTSKTTARTFIDDLVGKHGMLKAHIGDNPMPVSKSDCVYVKDFGQTFAVRLLGMATGFKSLTFLAKVDDANAYVQFFVRKHRGISTVRCRARTNFCVEYAEAGRTPGNYLGFLIFEH